MARTTKADVFNPDILTETVRGRFAQKDALMQAKTARLGAVVVRPNFEDGGSNRIGSTIKIPYFGTIGEFVSRADGSAVDFSAVGQMTEDATVGCDSLAFEATAWSELGAAPGTDPYEEGTSQIEKSAERAMDRAVIAAGSTSPLELDVHSLTNPRTMDYALMVDGKTSFWGDDQDDIACAIMHSRTKADLIKLVDSAGHPLLIPSMKEGEFDRFCGVPIIMSDKAPLTGSTMSAVTAAGTSPPTVTLSGTPNGPWDLVIDIVTGGASDGTATFRFRVKGSTNWSSTYAVPNGGGAFVLNDAKNAAVAPITGVKTADSLVGVNGVTGITATFANGTYNADNTYSATARLKVETQIVKKGALAFWYNQNKLELQLDRDISRDSKLAAMHLYRAAHLYRRTRMGNMPGVVRVLHNVSGYL